jgi:hypothetical protein
MSLVLLLLLLLLLLLGRAMLFVETLRHKTGGSGFDYR